MKINTENHVIKLTKEELLTIYGGDHTQTTSTNFATSRVISMVTGDVANT
ncbi:hypothetical protein [Aquimarina mytili]|uniref:Bacteriocin n=1 Tax=Aquimarina mytili TaxID=874423 RepID=A0A936ZTZ5_9FLAO|nr:hypothetical protein [Aquimarina mytili]MBL0682101.1 hypothetical protein [Aquimarina mytili]